MQDVDQCGDILWWYPNRYLHRRALLLCDEVHAMLFIQFHIEKVEVQGPQELQSKCFGKVFHGNESWDIILHASLLHFIHISTLSKDRDRRKVPKYGFPWSRVGALGPEQRKEIGVKWLSRVVRLLFHSGRHCKSLYNVRSAPKRRCWRNAQDHPKQRSKTKQLMKFNICVCLAWMRACSLPPLSL